MKNGPAAERTFGFGRFREMRARLQWTRYERDSEEMEDEFDRWAAQPGPACGRCPLNSTPVDGERSFRGLKLAGWATAPQVEV